MLLLIGSSSGVAMQHIRKLAYPRLKQFGRRPKSEHNVELKSDISEMS